MFCLSSELTEFLEDPFCGKVESGRFILAKPRVKGLRHDYIAILPPEAKNAQLGPKDFQKALEERKPWLSNFLDFEVTESNVKVSIKRHLAFLHVLRVVNFLGIKYGSNNLLDGKVICLKSHVGKEPKTLTELRIQKTHDVLSHLVHFCGGKVSEESSHIHLLLTHKSTESKNSILIGTVNETKNSSKSTTSPDEYERMRSEDIKSMCENKLETNCDLKNVTDLVQATILFDLIQSNLKKSVVLNLHEAKPNEKSTCKGALFVVYNYVRLATLLSKFQDLVQSKVYPVLPDLDEIDFSLLVQNEEWKIMLDFILQWPSVVKLAVKDLEVGRPRIHILFKFLVDFSTSFSLYYHRVRILTEPRPNLIPVLHARIHLMIGLLQVVQNAFQLVSLQPLNQM